MSVAVLGLGTMGGGMARRLLEKGFALGVWNRTPGAVAALTAAGATAHAHAGQTVASADIVLTMLPTADAVSEVMLRGGVLDAVRPGATWAQMGTIGIEATERLAADVARRRPDVTFVDAPCVSTVLKFSIRCEPGKSGIGDCRTSSGASDEATNVT